jgi:antitoxin HigA-1
MTLPPNRCPAHPGALLLREFLEPLNLSQAEFARHIGWTPVKLNELVRGKRGITHATALDLSDVFGTTPQFWLNLQANHDLWHALKHHKPKPRLKQVS